jgi:hypothetical protein
MDAKGGKVLNASLSYLHRFANGVAKKITI